MTLRDQNMNKIDRLTKAKPVPEMPQVEDVEASTEEILEPDMAEPAPILPEHEPGQEQDAETIGAIFKRIALEQDMGRIQVGAALLNVFNYAVQIQAGRNDWDHNDFRAFILAHAAVDQIGKAHIQNQKDIRDKSHLKAVESQIREQQQHPSARRTNLPQNKME